MIVGVQGLGVSVEKFGFQPGVGAFGAVCEYGFQISLVGISVHRGGDEFFIQFAVDLREERVKEKIYRGHFCILSDIGAVSLGDFSPDEQSGPP